MVQRPGFSTGSSFTNAACAPSLHQMARQRVQRRSPQENQPAQHTVCLASGAAAPGWPRHKNEKNILMPETVFFFQNSEKDV